MKKVLYLYDNLSQEINLQNLTQIESYKQYDFEAVFIRDVKDIKQCYAQSRPEVLILNLDFDYNKQIETIESISKTQINCKTIVLVRNKEFHEMLFNSYLAHRIFYYKNISKDSLANTISALLIEKNLALDDIYKISLYNELVEKLDLKRYNSATKHFVKCLYILYDNVSLLDGHINNAYYVVGKYDNVTCEAVKKSVIRVINIIKVSHNTDFIFSIFGTYDIKYYTTSEILQKIIGFLKMK